MFQWISHLKNIFHKDEIKPSEKPIEKDKKDDELMALLNWNKGVQMREEQELIDLYEKNFRLTAKDFQARPDATMDDFSQGLKNFSGENEPINGLTFRWYLSQGFIGWNACAIIGQHWLVNKACTMPAEDCIKDGFEVSVNDGSNVDTPIFDEIRKLDKKYLLHENIIEFIRFSKIFGIRIMMFEVDSPDPDYYLKPFNPDGILPGSYKGMVQIDPYWTTPELDSEATSNPASKDYYEPTWWRVTGKRIHKSHLIILKGPEPADILKANYFWGGIPLTQMIYERVYAAERIANEAPMLALTKRLNVYQVDMERAILDQCAFEQKIKYFQHLRDNYGIKVADVNENVSQLDTSLADLDAVIMTQYRIVAAQANVPSVKLMSDSPKGFHSSGSYEEHSYTESLMSLRREIEPAINRHHMMLIRSEISPKFNIAPFSTEVAWNPIDSMSAKELAEINKIKAETGLMLQQAGSIDSNDERQRIINDIDSGYNGIAEEIDPFQELLDKEIEKEESNREYEEFRKVDGPYIGLPKEEGSIDHKKKHK